MLVGCWDINAVDDAFQRRNHPVIYLEPKAAAY